MLYERALKIAAVAHKDQVRKHDSSPYIVHPVMVAHILSSYGFSEEVVAAGLVHDVLEDSEMTEDSLRKELGDIVFVEAVEGDTAVEAGKEMTTIESVKAASDIFAPLTGSVIECNAGLEDAPETINKDPYGEGWIVKIKLADAGQVDGLMSAEEYGKMIEG